MISYGKLVFEKGIATIGARHNRLLSVAYWLSFAALHALFPGVLNEYEDWVFAVGLLWDYSATFCGKMVTAGSSMPSLRQVSLRQPARSGTFFAPRVTSLSEASELMSSSGGKLKMSWYKYVGALAYDYDEYFISCDIFYALLVDGYKPYAHTYLYLYIYIYICIYT